MPAPFNDNGTTPDESLNRKVVDLQTAVTALQSGVGDVISVAGRAGVVVLSSADILGTATNDSAAAGYIGEYISALVASGAAVALTNNTAANVSSLSLTAGDWDVEGSINFAGTTATVTGGSGGITTTTATVPTDGTEAFDGTVTTLLSDTSSIALARKRFSLSATTTVYLVSKKSFSAGTVGAFGAITARRVR